MSSQHTPPSADTGSSSVARRAFGSGRLTAGRIAIADTVAATRGAFTVEDLVATLAREAPAFASQATVYRAVAALLETGFIERVGSRGGGALYARCECATSHHHHIVCDGCGRTVEADCPLGPAIAAGATAQGFTITRHEVTLYGLCDTCSHDGPVG